MKNKILASAILILLAKLILVSFVQGPTLIPDEACIFETAKHFSKSLEVEDCGNLLLEQFNQPPIATTIFYSIPHFITENHWAAYKIYLIINSLLISSLFLPISKILRWFKVKENHSLLATAAILLSPSVLSYEKTIMSETLFLFTAIWSIYFYIKGLEKSKYKKKVASLILSALSIFMRPFGFIILISLLINEFFIASKKHKLYWGIFGILMSALILFLKPDIINLVQVRITAFQEEANSLQYIAKTLLNSLNSLTIGSLVIFPALILSNLKNSKLKKIFPFLFSLVFLNSAINSQHLFGFIIGNNGLLGGIGFRYLNISIVTILIFGLAILLSDQKKVFNKLTIFWTVLFSLPILFLEINFVRNHIVHEYLHTFQMPIFANYYPRIFLALIIGLLLIIINEKRREFLLVTALFFFLHSSINIYQVNKLSTAAYKENSIYNNIKDQEFKILYIVSNEKKPNSNFFAIKLFSSNKVNIQEIEKEDLKAVISQQTESSEYDYLFIQTKNEISNTEFSSYKSDSFHIFPTVNTLKFHKKINNEA